MCPCSFLQAEWPFHFTTFLTSHTTVSSKLVSLHCLLFFCYKYVGINSQKPKLSNLKKFNLNFWQSHCTEFIYISHQNYNFACKASTLQLWLFKIHWNLAQMAVKSYISGNTTCKHNRNMILHQLSEIIPQVVLTFDSFLLCCLYAVSCVFLQPLRQTLGHLCSVALSITLLCLSETLIKITVLLLLSCSKQRMSYWFELHRWRRCWDSELIVKTWRQGLGSSLCFGAK